MNEIGFVISHKENEKRRAILPNQLKNVKHVGMLFFETGYGESLGFTDQEYVLQGAHIVSREEVLKKSIVCDPKIGDANYINILSEGQTIFGWIHAVQNREITNAILKNKLTAIAWEDMYEKGRHVFWRNNELAGEAAIMHSFTLYGRLPYECNVAIIGKGNIARGAYRILSALGANIKVYDKYMETLLREEIHQFDVIVNGVLWDVQRKDHIIYKEDLPRMKKPAMIIDISCDKAGAIETSIPTTIQDPMYKVNDVLHYVVDHTPALVSYSVSQTLGEEIVKYLDMLIENELHSLPSKTLSDAMIIQQGVIIDQRINEYQNRG